MVSWAFVFVLSYIFVNMIGSSNGLLPGDTKPLTDPNVDLPPLEHISK